MRAPQQYIVARGAAANCAAMAAMTERLCVSGTFSGCVRLVTRTQETT